ncbi:MAG: hypothetical protein ABJ246_05645 [Paracoccaceae bacterium]
MALFKKLDRYWAPDSDESAPKVSDAEAITVAVLATASQSELTELAFFPIPRKIPLVDVLRQLDPDWTQEIVAHFITEHTIYVDHFKPLWKAGLCERPDPAASDLFHRIAVELSEESGVADIDVSGSEFDFVRSIKVWNVLHYSHAKRGRNYECREHSNIQLGTYGAQGEFRWDPSEPSPVPDWVIPSRNCEPGSYARAVGVEWTDVEGNHGYEVVNY